METLQNWLLEQAPVIVVMGVIIYAQFKLIKAKDEEIKRLNDEAKGYADDYKQSAKEFTEVFTLVKDRLSK